MRSLQCQIEHLQANKTKHRENKLRKDKINNAFEIFKPIK